VRCCSWLLASLLLLPAGCSNRLFLHPTRDPIETSAERVRIEGTRFPLRHRHIEAFYEEMGVEPRSGEPDLYVLAFTGNGGRAEFELDAVTELLRPWLGRNDGGQRRLGVLAVNYPGFGGEPGPATLRRLGAAALDAYDYLVERARGAPVVVYGISMGTTAALHIAASQPAVPPAGLLLDRGPDVPGIVMGRFGWWNLWLAAGPVTLSLPRAVRSVPNARRIHDVPALFILGTRDTLVTPRNGGRVADRYGGPKQVVWLDIDHGSFIDAWSHPALFGGLSWLLERVEADAGADAGPV
jgi:pimeloyl-ACP methyl ester carboxylesterase